MKKNAKLCKFNNLNYYDTHHAELSPNLPLPSFTHPLDTLYLNPNPLPVSCLSSENERRVYGHWVYSPHNFSLNTQSQLLSLYPQNFTRFFLCIYLPVIEAQLNDNDLKN